MHDQPTQPPFVQPGDLLPDFLRSFWRRQVDTAEQETPDFRHPPLPLARIKKVMKSDPDVKVSGFLCELVLVLVCGNGKGKLTNVLNCFRDTDDSSGW